MCAVIGAYLQPGVMPSMYLPILQGIWAKSHERGRDGRGLTVVNYDGEHFEHKDVSRYNGSQKFPIGPIIKGFPKMLIGNLRAEPTTEYVEEKILEDQQPYYRRNWAIVHNGTIANDHELRNHIVKTKVDSAAIAEHLDQIEYDSNAVSGFDQDHKTFQEAILDLKGSFAILAIGRDQDKLHYACNYRPLWYVEIPEVGIFVASARNYLPEQFGPRMLQPYTLGHFWRTANGKVTLTVTGTLLGRQQSQAKAPRALVVCSGGLDSVVAATAMKRQGYDLTLLHFCYGSRAEGPEIDAIKQVATHLDASLIFQKVDVYRPEDSPLLQKDSKIAGGEAGAEFAHEWVPARNLVMLSMATAIAEARGIETIVLGNNLEEAGAYPDNEPEFIARFNDMLPFAVGDGKRVKVIMPVGNLMKHEIVALGLSIDAPLHLTWSCYRATEKKYDLAVGHRSHSKYIHCGTCGPCFMRRTAFKINRAEEVIQYDH